MRCVNGSLREPVPVCVADPLTCDWPRYIRYGYNKTKITIKGDLTLTRSASQGYACMMYKTLWLSGAVFRTNLGF